MKRLFSYDTPTGLAPKLITLDQMNILFDMLAEKYTDSQILEETNLPIEYFEEIKKYRDEEEWMYREDVMNALGYIISDYESSTTIM